MQIVLFDIDPHMTDAWKKEFQEDDVIIENTEFSQLMNSRKYKFDTVVSASNSFGIMDGGLDKAYANYWPQLEKNVRRAIHEAFLDEQPVGTSLIVEIPKTRGMRLSEYSFSNNLFSISAATSLEDLILARKHLHNDILSHADEYSRGRTDIFIVRDKKQKIIASVGVLKGKPLNLSLKYKNQERELITFVSEWVHKCNKSLLA